MRLTVLLVLVPVLAGCGASPPPPRGSGDRAFKPAWALVAVACWSGLDGDEQLGKVRDVLPDIIVALAPGSLSLQFAAVCSQEGIERFRRITVTQGCESRG